MMWFILKVQPRHVEGYGRRMRKRSKFLQNLQQHKEAQDSQRPWSPATGKVFLIFYFSI